MKKKLPTIIVGLFSSREKAPTKNDFHNRNTFEKAKTGKKFSGRNRIVPGNPKLEPFRLEKDSLKTSKDPKWK